MKLKNILGGMAFASLLILLVLAVSQKDKMNQFVSSSLKNQVSAEAKLAGQELIDSLYNYAANGESYQLTFLEFGAEGCISCRKMKKVMEEVKNHYPAKVNVVFMNALKEESQQLMKMYGIASIPTQILLDKKGKEFYRHSGYISFDDLSKEFH
ncbi:thioredoxin family protein [Marinifilum caeruleilacunae]|uniref:Thioredoxin n=1 Tax=Marinifilum caeruleilacunae TaxID=2499076 RepID=A0ABX1WQF4_9BACT|nr:thioredoxin family protein [Marinifilum caeruleilacunae]NOU58317.1 thioredoxin [Marinifilum caeruleilacunae]